MCGWGQSVSLSAYLWHLGELWAVSVRIKLNYKTATGRLAAINILLGIMTGSCRVYMPILVWFVKGNVVSMILEETNKISDSLGEIYKCRMAPVPHLENFKSVVP